MPKDPKMRKRMRSRMPYPQGPLAYFKYLQQWRADGAFEGLVFDRVSAMSKL